MTEISVIDVNAISLAVVSRLMLIPAEKSLIFVQALVDTVMFLDELDSDCK